MVKLITFAAATAMFTTGALLALMAGGCVVACACRKMRMAGTRDNPEKPRPEPRKG